MAKVATNITIDSEVKKQSQEMLKELGMDLSTAVNIFLRQMLREGRIPFDIKLDIPNEETIKAMNDEEHDLGPFDTIEEMWEALGVKDKSIKKV